MFGFKKRVKVPDDQIVAVADGTSIPLTEVKDEVFSKKMMGDGVAFTLSGNKLVAPCNGEITAVFPGGHAYGLKMKNGAEVLVHFGLETVSLHGKGISPEVQKGDQVQAGDTLSKLDLSTLNATGLDLTTMIIITNPNGYVLTKSEYGPVKKGETPVMALTSSEG